MRHSNLAGRCSLLAVRVLALCVAAILQILVLGTFLGAAPAHAQGLEPGGPIDFGSLEVGAPIKTYSITFSATTSTTIESVSAVVQGGANKDYTVVSQNCVGTLLPPQSCTVEIGFSPTEPGLRRGALILTDASGTAVNRIFMEGVGLGPQLVFSPAQGYALTSLAPSITPASFTPSSVTVDGQSYIYFNDSQYDRILRENSDGQVVVIDLLMTTPHTAMTVDGAGTLYITSGATVYSLTPGGNATIFPTGTTPLVSPEGLATDGLGNVYISDSTLNEVVVVTPAGTSSVFQINGLSTPLNSPHGMCVDSNNNLYIADTGNNRIVKVALYTGAATVLSASVSSPYDVAVDPEGNVLVADTGNQRVLDIPATGSPFPLPIAGVTLAQPISLRLEPNGDVLIADATAGLITLTRATDAVNFATATHIGQLDSTDGPQTVSISNIGNEGLLFDVPSGSSGDPLFSNSSFAATDSSTCPVLTSSSIIGSNTELAAGASCNYMVSFTPSAAGAITGTGTINGAGVNGATMAATTFSLAGTGLSNTASFTVTATPSTTQPNSPVSLTISALTAAGAVDTTYRGTITFSSSDPSAQFLAGTTYTFTAADAGAHTFTAPASGVTFPNTGTFTVSATDGTASGTSNTIDVTEATGFTITASPSTTSIGVPVGFTITATFNGAPAPRYTGTVNFSATDSTAKFLSGASYTFTSADAGTHTFTAAQGVQFNQAGTFTIGATDGTNTGTSNSVQVVGATGFSIVATPSTTSVGAPVAFTVTAMQGTSVSTNFTGTVIFSATDPLAKFLGGASYTFTSADAGTHTFIAADGAQFNSIGSFTIAATDGNLTGISNAVQVIGIAGITLTSSANPVLASSPFTLTATVTGTGGTPTGTVAFYDGTTSLGSAPVVNGVATLTTALYDTGTHSLTATYSGNFAGATSQPLSELVEDFAVSVASGASASASVLPGGTAKYSLTVSAVGGPTLAAPVTLSVSGAPSGATVTLTPSSVAAGAGTTTFQLAITPLNTTAALAQHNSPFGRGTEIPAGMALLALPFAALLGKRRRMAARLLIFTLALLPAVALTGCITSTKDGYFGTQPGSYVVTVTGSSGTLSRSTQVNLTTE